MCNEFVEGMGYLMCVTLIVGFGSGIVWVMTSVVTLREDMEIAEKNIAYLTREVNEKIRDKKTR